MRRILFGVIVMLAFIESVWAATTEYRVQYSDGVNTYIKNFDSITTEYDLYLDDEEVDISDYQTIHNIAYYGYNGGDDLDRITSQIMIWENVYPNYSFEVINELGNIVNLSYYRRYITRVLGYYAKPCVLEGIVSNVEYGGTITYVGEYSMEAYTTDKFFKSVSDKVIVLDNITGVGTNIVHFIVKENINNNRITATSPSFGEFTTTINCLGNKIIFDTNDLAFIFDMYNTDTGDLIGTYFIDKNNNYIEYPYGINVTLVDVTGSTEYQKMDNIIINENDNHEYEITLNPIFYPRTIKFIAPLVNENYNIINIDIYNTNNELIKEIRCNNSCTYDLDKGLYKLVNNNTKEEINISLDYDIELDLSNNYLKALISEYSINEIKYNDLIVSYKEDGNYIYLDDYIEGNISVKIDNNYYEVSLDNLEYIDSIGLIKRLNIELINKEEIDEELIIPTNNEEEYVEIDIPNTEDNNVIWGEYYVKKKYYSSYYSIIYNYI